MDNTTIAKLKTIIFHYPKVYKKKHLFDNQWIALSKLFKFKYEYQEIGLSGGEEDRLEEKERIKSWGKD